MAFEPIAIVAKACVLPDALSPEALWENVIAGKSSLSSAPTGRWGLDPALALTAGSDGRDRAFSDVGGYVRGFDERFDSRGFSLPEEQVRALDPLFRWTLHGVREALRAIGFERPSDRAGLVLGNLSFPSTGLSRFAENIWTEGKTGPRPHPYNRFSSGLPAHLAAKAVGLLGGSFAVDAACASSLYAIKLACDRLHDRRADVMVAGAVNGADSLFLHVGFSALSALSKSGQSRPFHRDADGLIPSEGAAFAVLKRLDDAVRAGDRILGVIRGVGLSNDGRGRGMLAPAEEGQERAMRLAYAESGLTPADISLLECHATGTVVGDATEVRSAARVFADVADLPIGSLKSNLGHLITVAGMAALLKVLGAMDARVKPPTLHADAPIDALSGTPLRLLQKAESWTGPRRAALSAFGFGGNNAHLIVEAWEGSAPNTNVTVAAGVAPTDRVAIVGIGARVGQGISAAEFGRDLFDGRAHGAARGTVDVDLEGLRFPPRDLSQVLPQQLLVLEAAREAAAGFSLPRERTAVLVGMGCDAEVARYGARWRVAGWGADWQADDAWVADARAAFVPVLEAAGVVGTMPNIVANRINTQLDLAGPSFSISAEEASGTTALALAARALLAGELDAALVGAVELAHEPVHRAALAALGHAAPPGDAAVVLVLERVSDARAHGHEIFAVLGAETEPTLVLGDGPGAIDLAAVFGRAHAASGLVHVAAATLALRYGLRPHAGAAATAWTGERVAEVRVAPLEGTPSTLRLSSSHLPVELSAAPPKTGAKLTLPAHAPTPHLPPLENAMQIMQPAPWLPSVFGDGPVPVATAIVPAPVASVFVAPTPQLGSTPTPPASFAMSGVLARMGAHHAQLAAAHAAFMAQQAAVHAQFLELRQRTENGLLQAYGAALQGHVAAPSVATYAAPSTPPYAPPPVIAPPVVVSNIPPVGVPAPQAPALVAAPSVAPIARVLPGPKLSRRDLEVMASGSISSILGPEFAPQDGYARQVRMPEPPLLLADRVTGIDAVPLSMGTGTLWTETDVRPDSWYLDDQGRMPAGVMIEAGQADLLLIGYLGADMQNKSERVYRLLGCELTYHGGLCAPGDTLVYDIHVDGHAAQGDVRLFFFHYDCRVRGEARLTVRHGQAGFFTDQELADSGGILWDPQTEKPTPGSVDAPAVKCTKRSLSKSDLRAFAQGRALECFGPGWERTCTHVRTPKITGDRMQFLDEVTELDPAGGPWGRGYLRAETTLGPNDWFFDGHFKNDPCMPGTLMFEGCLQAMAVYLASLGYTVDRDGWRFEPVPDEKYQMRCRGQATPESRKLTYEVFVSSVSAGPEPTVFADLLCTVDGRKAFHAKRVGLRLVPSWPLSHWRALGPHLEQTSGEPVALRTLGGMKGHQEVGAVAVVDGFTFGYDSLLACAWGPPSEAFGPFYSRFDGTRKVARLPGPPYHFMSRVTHVDPPIGGMRKGTKTEIAYDVPRDSWYFEQNAYPTMPYCVLLEAALQPCGWLASYVGSALTTDIDLLFRNLDGTATQLVEVLPTSGTLRTKVELTSVSQSAGMIIEGFKVQCLVDDLPVYEMTTVFGFFPKEAFEDQVGLPVSDEDRARINESSDFSVDLTSRPARYCEGSLRLPSDMLLMLDRVTGYWPDGGKAKLGYLRAEKDVDVDEWFFKAHFFQDPVQPGSLGIEAICQLLQFYMLETGMGQGIENPRFEPLMLGKPLTWKYRGQVVPSNKRIGSEIEITAVGEDEKGKFAVCDGFLWVDGKRIYLAKNMGMRIVAGGAPTKPKAPKVTEEVLDPTVDRWLLDHCPTWTIPALPMMSMVDRLVGAAEARAGRKVSSLADVRIHRWLPFPGGPVRLRTSVEGDGDDLEVTLSAWREASDAALSRFEPVATARAKFGSDVAAPAAFAPLTDGVPEANPYELGALFHGPAFRYLTSLTRGSTGASATLRAENGDVPRGALHQGLLDGVTHAIPHDAFSKWSADISATEVGYPYRIPEITFHGALPDAGDVHVEARFAGFDGAKRFPMVDLQVSAKGKVLITMRLVEVLLPMGRLGSVSPVSRSAFLRDRRFAPGVGLSTFDGTTTRLTDADVRESDWLPGTVAGIYGLAPSVRSPRTAEIAVREHIARRAFVHPSALVLEPNLASGSALVRPLRKHAVRVHEADGVVTVVDAAPPTQDLEGVRAYWAQRFAVGPWPVEDLYYGLIERFVGDVIVTAPEAFAKVEGQSCLYLGNHQVGVESLLFSVLVSALSKTPTVTLAKAEHRTSWLGELIAHNFAYPGVEDPRLITFFDREDRDSLVSIIGELAEEMRTSKKSVMVHVEGTRALAANRPVVKMSSAFLDMALGVGAPIVPVRFMGGLPRAELTERLEFPVGFGRQDIWIGAPIFPSDLAKLPYKERKELVLAAMNGLGPADETPPAGDAAFGARAREWSERTDAGAEHAVLLQTLMGLAAPGEPVRALIDGAKSGTLDITPDPRSQWLGRLARWLYGPRGPVVRG